MPPAGEVALRIRAKGLGITPDEATISHGEKALPDPIRILEGRLTNIKWMLGDDNVVEKAGFSSALLSFLGRAHT